ncbi:MAG TPA: autotransporter-associated beta strand repeat-containing protein, partial [Pirellulales bacterium]
PNAGTNLTISPSNGYAVAFSGTTTFSQALTTLTVNTNGAVTSNVLPSAILSGQVTGTAGASGTAEWTKAGTGNLLLTNAANNFIGNMVVTGGLLGFTSNGSGGGTLGNTANTITLNGGGIYATSATSATQYVTTPTTAATAITSARTIDFLSATAANNIIDVANNTTLTLTSPFGPTNNGFAKNDLGTLVLSANNDQWGGSITVNEGALQITNAGALGLPTGAVTLVYGASVNQGGALQLGGVTLDKPISSVEGTGINSGGVIEAVYNSTNQVGGISTSTINGQITLVSGAITIGADANTVLNIQGGYIANATVTFAGAGNINIDTTSPTTTTGLTKIGSGTTTLGVAYPAMVGALSVNAGTFYMGGILGGGAGSLGGTGAVTVNPGAIFTVDDSVGLPIANRLDAAAGVRALTVEGGTFNYIGSPIGNSSETLGAYTPGAGLSYINITAGASESATITVASTAAAAAGAQLIMSGTNLGSAGVGGTNVADFTSTTGPTFVGASGLTGTENKGILPWALVNTGSGYTFATVDSSTGTTGANGGVWRPLSSSEYVTSMAAAYAPTVNNIVLSASDTVLATFTDNSLNMTTASTLTINPVQTFTLSSGGLIMTGGSTIQGGFLNAGGVALELFQPAGGTSTISSQILGTAGMNVAAGTGTIQLTSFEPYTGQTTVNQGTLQLAAGTNTLVVGVAATGQALVVNSGGTLDLDGNVQVVSTLASTGAAVAAGTNGGTITTSTGTGLLDANVTTASVFAGSITGSVDFIKSGGTTLTLLSANTYAGTTLINGAGGVVLEDYGTLATGSTNPINVTYSSLTLNNTGLTDSSTRLNSGAPINLSGSTFAFTSRTDAMSYENVGAVTIGQGVSTITNTLTAPGAGQVGSSTLSLASLAQTAGSGGVVNFTNTGGTLGTIGNNPQILVGSAPALTNNLIGGWAIVNGADFAGYSPTLGVAALGTAGFAGYDFTLANTFSGYTASATANLKITGVATSLIGAPTGTTAMNSLNLVSTVTGGGISFTNATDTLNITSGGLLHSGSFTAQIGSAAGNGQLTAGGASATSGNTYGLYITNNATTALTIDSNVVNVGAVIGGGNTANNQLVLTNLSTGGITLAGTNAYTGGTVINGGTTTLATSGTLGTGGITLNGGAFTQTAGGVIPSQAVTINGASTFTFAGTNTFTGAIALNNNGGAAATLAAGTGTLNLGSGGTITASSDNVTAPAVLSGTLVDIGSSAYTI